MFIIICGVKGKPLMFPLGLVHGDIGVAHQHIGVLAVLRAQRHTDTHTGSQTVTFNFYRAFHGSEYLAANRLTDYGVRARQQHRKFIAAQAGDSICTP